jgi:hypothetical protein
LSIPAGFYDYFGAELAGEFILQVENVRGLGPDGYFGLADACKVSSDQPFNLADAQPPCQCPVCSFPPQFINRQGKYRPGVAHRQLAVY